jgi:O-antigen/teichoic acid export membrane protein
VSFALLTTILLTGYLGKEGYGQYMYVITLAVLFGNLADWGTGMIGVRELAKTAKQEESLGQILGLRLGLAVMAAAVLGGWSWVAAVLVFLTGMRSSLGLIFQARLKTQWLVPAEIVSGGLTLALTYFFVQRQMGLTAMLAAVMAAGLAAVLVNGVLAGREIKISWQFNWRKWRVLLIEALPMGAILWLFTAVNKVDTLILAQLKGVAAVGIYALTYRVYDVLILGAAYLMNSFLPLMVQEYQRKDGQIKIGKMVKRGIRILAVGGGVMLIGVLITAPWLIQILTQKRFGEFTEAVGVLRILAVAIFLAYFNHLTGYTLVALSQQKKYLKVPILALIFNIGLNFLLIPKYSYWAAAWVTVATEGLVLIVTARYLYKILNK